MDPQDTTQSMHDLIAALADGELDLCENPQAFAQLAQDAQAVQRIAHQQQLRRACRKTMGDPAMCCPHELAAKVKAMAGGGTASNPAAPKPAPPAVTTRAPAARPPVLARIGRWVPSAVAAVLLVAATAMFIQSSGAGSTRSGGVASLLTAQQVENFDSRHADCAQKPDILHRHEDFGDVADLEQLPIKLGDYFKTSTDGMRLNLSGIGYDYQLTGACGIPGSGSVHIVYRHHTSPDRAISIWLRPDDGTLTTLEPDRVYVEAGRTLDHPVILWRSGGLIYYLVGDSLQDAHDAVDALRQTA